MSDISTQVDQSKMHVLLISSDGMLGRAWEILLRDQSIRCTPTMLDDFDITNEADISKWISGDVTHVVNCAAWTDVDGAETNEEIATQVNGHAVGLLATRCEKVGATLIHYSTDYVFNGLGDTPYKVDDEIDPINAYGRGKWVAEQAIAASGCHYLIIRTSWLYAPWGKNFVETIARLAKDKDELKVVDDQRGRPTSCQHLAEISLALAVKNTTGTYHVNDGGECTWYDFACEIVKLTGSGCVMHPCTSDEYPRLAKRPAYSVMDLSKTEMLVGEMRSWQDNLRDVIACLESVSTNH